MGDGLRGMAMNLFASTAMVGQSAVRGLTWGAQEVRPSHIDFGKYTINVLLTQWPTAPHAAQTTQSAMRPCRIPLAHAQVITVAGNALSSGSAGPRGLLQRGAASQAAPRLRTRLALPQLRFPGRRRAALVTA